MAMGSENLRLCRRAIRVIAIVALLFGVLDGVLQQQTYLTAPAERTRTKLLEAVAAGKELHGVRPHKLGDEWVYVLQLEPDFAAARKRWNFRHGKTRGRSTRTSSRCCWRPRPSGRWPPG